MALQLTLKINKNMELKNIIILTQVKGIGPAFFKKNRSRLMFCNDCVSFIKEINENALLELSVYERFAENVRHKIYSVDLKALGITDYGQLMPRNMV